MTLLRGNILLNDGKLEQNPGIGNFIHANPPTPPISGISHWNI